ncbi:YkgJ family cysteine cluster protein [Lacrimispora amygdalina]|uniref:YkgJ family cysteine cluster protein n=1 Tax=Lacrimispora amygdalina TaxID=253257 RepID=A0A3E2N7Z9_9FIRM|nr:flagellin lysine-N-methylase [Clostridium indicum]RFZ77137.1 YkgJ family cysteine cluster protein [Clostridium indicum]
MQVTIPHYYPGFHCIADHCSDTCCAGWAIMIDDASMKKYRAQTDLLGRKLLNGIDWKKGCFKQSHGRCAFLNEMNLCDMYTDGGPSMLCKTCREYPRHTEEYEGVRELSLSMSCEEAARLILGLKEPVRFLTKEDDREETYPEFDFFLYSKLMDVREEIFSLLQNRNREISLRAAMILGLGHDLQKRIRDGKLYQTEELIVRYRQAGCEEFFRMKSREYTAPHGERYIRMNNWFSLFDKLEVLSQEWPAYIGELKILLFEQGPDQYGKKREEFYEYIETVPERKREWSQWLEQLLVYFVYTYFCGAVYDEHPYVKVKMAVICTILIEELALAIYIRHPGCLSFDDFTRLVHRFSREIEHSDVNLNTLENSFRTEEVYGLKEILRVL